MPKNSEKYIYIGFSSRGASNEEKLRISADVKKICSVISTEGFSYYADESLLSPSVNKTNPKSDIPKRYFTDISESTIESIAGLRANNDPEKLRNDIAMCNWVDDLFEKSSGCIWYIGRSWLGGGVEIMTALEKLERQCLLLFSTESISSLLNGNLSRLLTIRETGRLIEKSRTREFDNTLVEQYVRTFLKKIESRFDRELRFKVSSETERWVLNSARKGGFKSSNEYLRDLLRRERGE